MAYDFHYTPTGTGVISGKEVLEQTEDAINDLGNTAISGVQEALDKAEQALTNSANAVDDAQTALNTANNAEGVAIQAQTDVGNLSGTVTNIGNRVTTAEGNISNLQGRMTTAESNITNLQGRMTTAETNIGNLQTAVSTAQATANSAQQTATTARQQSYVFRYSSTALVASSTNSNTLLDNTDNLKVGDKVIDSNGVLFSITAIDSVNSTFTIGSALVDLALDANVVHTSGNETISGDKVFNNRLIKNIDVVLGTAPSTGKFSNIDIADNNKSSLLQILGGVYDTGNSYARFFVQNKTADDGTGLSPTGTLRGCGFNINLPATSTSDGQGSITPRANKTTDFGLLSYQWRNLWCETLFLNGTQLDPSAFALDNAVVHLSGNETVGGEKTFTSSIKGYNSDSTQSTVSIDLRTSKVSRGNTSDGVDTFGFGFRDKNNSALASITCVKRSTGETSEYHTVNTTDSSNNVLSESYSFNLSKDGTSIFRPETNDKTLLGTSTKRWSGVYATNYYYGSDNVEFSTKFVTTDTAQTITEIKTFTNTIKSKKEIELTGSRLAYILSEFSAGYSGLSLCTYGSNGAVKIGTWKVDDNDNTKHVLNDSLGYLNVTTGVVNSVNSVYLTPRNGTDSKLGDSTNKWKEINGLTPSSLSLPSNTGYVDISGYFTNTGDGQTNSYTASVNGWIYLNVVATRLIMQIRDSNDNNIYADMRVRSSDGTIYMTIPIGSGNKLLTQWFTSSSVTVTTARFIPCQGNI